MTFKPTSKKQVLPQASTL